MYAEAIAEHGLEAWVLWDFRGSNPILWDVLGAEAPGTSRRAVLVLPADGEPRLVCSVLDRPLLDRLGVPLDVYADRHEFVERLGSFGGRVAMEYSPLSALPIASFADAGAVELIRSLGAEVVSSADLFQSVAAAWDEQAEASHHRAVEHVMDLHALARDVALGRTETEVEARVMDELHSRGLLSDGTPGVSVGPHSGDPHHEPDGTTITEGEVLLVDIWAREDGPRTAFADVTWMSWTGAGEPPPQCREVLGVVAAARDAAIAAAQPGRPAFEGDRAARAVIESAGYGHGLLHRTGHSLSPGRKVHGLGANLDDTETHDTRVLTARSAYTVEPGVYLEEFGVRLECDVLGGRPTTPLQSEFSLL